VYDTTTNTWSGKHASNTEHTYGGGVAINGLFYVFGGCVNSDCNAQVTGVLEVYDPVGDTWTTKAPMLTARNAMAFDTIGGLIYVAGGQADGYAALSAVEVYDPVANTWTAKTPMTTAVRGMSGAALNSKLYVAGGTAGGAGSTAVVATVQVYDSIHDSWTAGTPLPGPLQGQCCTSFNGLLYALGGSTNAGNLTQALAFDPGTSVWSTLTAMPISRFYFGCAATTTGLLVVGPTTEVDAYTP
jgi:N-acetylneuraminic acid mutarotase